MVEIIFFYEDIKSTHDTTISVTKINVSRRSEGGFLSHREEITGPHTQGSGGGGGGAFSPMLGSRVLTYADEDSTHERNIYDIPDYIEPPNSPVPQVHEYISPLSATLKKPTELLIPMLLHPSRKPDIGGRLGNHKNHAGRAGPFRVQRQGRPGPRHADPGVASRAQHAGRSLLPEAQRGRPGRLHQRDRRERHAARARGQFDPPVAGLRHRRAHVDRETERSVQCAGGHRGSAGRGTFLQVWCILIFVWLWLKLEID